MKSGRVTVRTVRDPEGRPAVLFGVTDEWWVVMAPDDADAVSVALAERAHYARGVQAEPDGEIPTMSGDRLPSRRRWRRRT